MSSEDVLEISCAPSYPTIFLLPEATRRNKEKEFEYEATATYIEDAFQRMRDTRSCDLSESSSTQTLSRACKTIEDATQALRDLLPTGSGDSEPQSQMFVAACERVKTQAAIGSGLLRLAYRLKYHKKHGDKLTDSERITLKKRLVKVSNQVQKDFDKLREETVIYDAWAQIVSLDQTQATECKKLISSALNNVELKFSAPRDFAKMLLQENQPFGPNVTGDAKIIRKAIEDEVAEYNLQASPEHTDGEQRRAQKYYAFESLLGDHKWILQCTDWHEYILEETKKPGLVQLFGGGKPEPSDDSGPVGASTGRKRKAAGDVSSGRKKRTVTDA